MQKLFVKHVPEGQLTLEGEQARHIAGSLRMKAGDMLIVTDGSGSDYGCMIEAVTKETVTLKVCYRQASDSEPSCQVTLFQGVPKGSKMEDIVQKCTELGVTRIVPTLTKRCIARPDEKGAQKKNARYQKIALEAAQQSGRGIVPEVAPQCTLKQALSQDDSTLKILFYEGGGAPLTELIPPDAERVSVYIGPEGGFEKDEVALLMANGAVCATLGKRILRTQTAPVAALAAIMLLTGNME